MAYIGPEPNPGQNREVDDISSGFNGSEVNFTLQVNSQNVSPGSSNNIIVSLGGVVQNPGTDYNIAASTLTFTTAPASGLSFFGLVLGQQVDIQSLADGTSPTMSAPTITGDLTVDTNTLKVDSSNNRVGIGTASPSQKLHLKDTAPMAQIESSSYSSFVGTAEANDNIGNGTKAGNLVLRGQTGIAISGNNGTATQVKIDADGLKFGTDTAAANALHDYEEGNCPNLAFRASNASGDSNTSVQESKYIKIGGMVHFSFYIDMNAHHASGTGGMVKIVGLPFQNTGNHVAISVGYFNHFIQNQNFVSGTVQPGTSEILLRHTTTETTTTSNMDYSNAIGTSTEIIISGCYGTAS